MSDQGDLRPRRPREETKQLLLDAARSRLLEIGRESPVDVRLVDVVQAKGMTTGAAYQIWDSQDEFRRDVATYVASEFDWAGPQLIADEAKKLVERGASPEERVRVIGRRYFELFVANEEYFTVLQLVAVPDPAPELAKALQQGYDVVHEGFVAFFSALLDAYGKRIRAPYTIDDVAVVVTAITEGLALRWRIQPDRIRTAVADENYGDEADWHLYSSALLAASQHFTEPVPD